MDSSSEEDEKMKEAYSIEDMLGALSEDDRCSQGIESNIGTVKIF